ncbi:MAG: CAP domain-containing protein [Candidatus Hadarchaeum sp.]
MAVVAALFYYLPGNALTDKVASLQNWARGLGEEVSSPKPNYQQRTSKTSVSNVVQAKEQFSGQTKPKEIGTPVIHAGGPKSLQMEQDIFKTINEQRKKLGLRPFIWDDKVAELARLKAVEAFEIKILTHKSPKYGDPGKILDKYGIDWRRVGEVAEADSRVNPDPVKFAMGWFERPSHREIMTDNYERIGVGIARVEAGVDFVDDDSKVLMRWVGFGIAYTPK